MNKKILLALIPAVLMAGVILWYLAFREEDKTPNRLVVTGNIEATEVALSFKIPGRVVIRHVSEGERIKIDQLVARLDASDLEPEVALKKAELAAARAKLSELEAGYRTEEVAQARAALEKARAEARNARDEFRRQKELFEEKVIAEKAYDTAATAYRVAREAARELEERLSMLEKGYRTEQVAKARANMDQAEAALALSRTRLDYATLRAPLTGTVLTDNIEAGEYVNPGTPVVTIGNLEKIWLRAYISETDLGRVKRGQPAWITTDTYPGKRYEGRVTFISSEAEFTPKQVQTDEQRVKLMYRIKITAPNLDFELKPGMPADAVIRLAEPT